MHASALERRHLLGGGAFAAGNDRAGMTHPTSWRRSLSGDEPDHRLSKFTADEIGRVFLRGSSDFANHDHGVRLGIGGKQRSASMKFVPISGSPPIPMHVVSHALRVN